MPTCENMTIPHLRNVSRGVLLLLITLAAKPVDSLDVAHHRIARRGNPAATNVLVARHAGTNQSLLAIETIANEKLLLSTNSHAAFSGNRMTPMTHRSVLSLARGGDTAEEGDGSDASKDTPGASNVLSYYLLWSPGVFRKTIYSVVALLALRIASIPFQQELSKLAASSTMSSPVGFIIQVVLFPLLSSACCGIQLAINAFVGAGGCAGFNKVLGPLRPYFVATLLVTTAATFPAHHQSRAAIVKWIQYSLLRWFVALMPEMVHLWNICVAERVQSLDTTLKGSGDVVTTIEMTIPTMGCVACINKIDSSMRQCAPNQIEEAKSWLEPSGKGGRALVRGYASTKEEAERLAESLVDAVRGAGFEPCVVDSIRIQGKTDGPV